MFICISKIKVRISNVLGLLSGCFIVACASGPVTTQIDLKKNPVAAPPVQFQSPAEAIDGFLRPENGKTYKDASIIRVRGGALKTLINQQVDIANELKLSGRLRLQAGYSYDFSLESFCIHTGVERPVRGDGLFLGNIQGSAKSWLPAILSKYEVLGISQSDAQILVWSLLSKTKFDELSSKNQTLLLKIFPDAPFRFGHSFLEEKTSDFLMSQAPSELLSAREKFYEYRNILQDTQRKYSEIEQVLSPFSSRIEPIDVGWLKHEDGYFIHMQADGYQRVRVKIYVPEELKKDTFFEPNKHVALPGQGQRLALSANVVDKYGNKLGQYTKEKSGVSAAEVLFILKHPIDSLKIYEASQKALLLTWKHQTSLNKFEDDQADAFRHFIWSGLVTNEIGADKAKEYLSAHENFPGNKQESKSMDIFNNNKGIEYSQNYRGNSFEKDLVQEGQDKIRDRELRWLK